MSLVVSRREPASGGVIMNPSARAKVDLKVASVASRRVSRPNVGESSCGLGSSISGQTRNIPSLFSFFDSKD